MEAKPIPYRKTVFVCTHRREDGRVACSNPGRDGEDILKSLKEGIHAAGLKGKVRVAKSGCLDLCEKGPNVFVHPSGEWFSGVAMHDVPALLERIKV